MNFSALDGSTAPYLMLIVFGFLPSVVWKLLSAFVAHGIDEESELLVWVRSVASTLLAGVACKLVLFPSGALAASPAPLRFGALAMGIAVFRFAGRSIVAAVLAGEAALMAGTWFWAG